VRLQRATGTAKSALSAAIAATRTTAASKDEWPTRTTSTWVTASGRHGGTGSPATAASGAGISTSRGMAGEAEAVAMADAARSSALRTKGGAATGTDTPAMVAVRRLAHRSASLAASSSKATTRAATVSAIASSASPAPPPAAALAAQAGSRTRSKVVAGADWRRLSAASPTCHVAAAVAQLTQHGVRRWPRALIATSSGLVRPAPPSCGAAATMKPLLPRWIPTMELPPALAMTTKYLNVRFNAAPAAQRARQRVWWMQWPIGGFLQRMTSVCAFPEVPPQLRRVPRGPLANGGDDIGLGGRG
jgi:hypothetical protein